MNRHRLARLMNRPIHNRVIVSGRHVLPSHRGGFSLIEMMIALTILGLGLVMVATLFPVAWTRARQLSEYTTQAAVTENVGMAMDLIMPVGGFDTRVGSFAGDAIMYIDWDATDPEPVLLFKPDHRVHALHLENILVSAPRGFTPDREDPLASSDARKNVGAPWQLEQFRDERIAVYSPLPGDWPPFMFETAFGAPQIRFHQRVYPSLRTRSIESVDATGEFQSDKPDPQWDEALDTRRFAWAVFHRLREPKFNLSLLDANVDWNSAAAVKAAKNELAQSRVFDIYYVTLRRTQPSHRYAQQDPDPDKTPCPVAGSADVSPRRGEPVTPAALPADYDVLLPVPWRVQVYFPDNLAVGDDDDPPTGAPTVIEVNTENAPSAPFMVDFFQPGTQLIDEVNGKIYRVVRRRLAGDEDEQAYVTLDREILLGDIDDGYLDPNIPPDPVSNHFANGNIEDEDDELLRTVWVFPPPVQATRLEKDVPIFDGKQPVVGIDMRKLTINPKRKSASGS